MDEKAVQDSMREAFAQVVPADCLEDFLKKISYISEYRDDNPSDVDTTDQEAK